MRETIWRRAASLCAVGCFVFFLCTSCGNQAGDESGSPEVSPESRVTYFSGPVPRIIAHRGGEGLFPENTLYAFEQVLALGAHIIETDVWSTKDGQIVILHDEKVDRTTNGSGSVRTKTLEQVKSLDAAWWFTTDGGGSYPLRGQGITVPTLDEAFRLFPDTRFCIEIKQESPHIEQDVLSLVEIHGMQEKVCLGSFIDPVLERVRKQNPDICTGAGILGTFLFLITPLEILRLQEIPVQAFQIPEEEVGIRILTPAFVDKAVQLGIEVHVWTLNEVEDMQAALAMGAHGIITDYPDRLIDLLENILVSP